MRRPQSCMVFDVDLDGLNDFARSRQNIQGSRNFWTAFWVKNSKIQNFNIKSVSLIILLNESEFSVQKASK